MGKGRTRRAGYMQKLMAMVEEIRANQAKG